MTITAIEVDGKEIKVGESYYGDHTTPDTIEAIKFIGGHLLIQLTGKEFYFHYVKPEDFWSEYRF